MKEGNGERSRKEGRKEKLRARMTNTLRMKRKTKKISVISLWMLKEDLFTRSARSAKRSTQTRKSIDIYCIPAVLLFKFDKPFS